MFKSFKLITPNLIKELDPCIDLSRIGVWESNGEIAGLIHPEHSYGTVYFQVDPEHASLKPEMLSYAELKKLPS